MTQANEEERAVARGLRMEGWSYRRIAKELGVSMSSAYSWSHDIELTPEQEAVNKERQIHRGEDNKGAQVNKATALVQRKQYQEQGRIKAREGSRLHMIGCMLYWAEGAKSVRSVLHFANSDVKMILVFARFLREELVVTDDAMKVQIHCYTKTDEERQAVEQYWLDILKLSIENLIKTQVLESSGRSQNRLKYGVCTLRVYSSELFQHIFGAIQEYGDFVHQDWLY